MVTKKKLTGRIALSISLAHQERHQVLRALRITDVHTLLLLEMRGDHGMLEHVRRNVLLLLLLLLLRAKGHLLLRLQLRGLWRETRNEPAHAGGTSEDLARPTQVDAGACWPETVHLVEPEGGLVGRSRHRRACDGRVVEAHATPAEAVEARLQGPARLQT